MSNNAENKKSRVNDSWYKSFFKVTIPNALFNGELTIVLLVFLGGIMTSLSPCILSMLPILLGYIGGLEKLTKTKGFITSVSFVRYIYSRSKKFTPLTKMESLYYLSKRWTINNVGFIFLRTYRLVIKAREQLICTIAGGAEPFP